MPSKRKRDGCPDGCFVEDAEWHAAKQRYRRFAEGMRTQRTVLLELGVGWNTPVWIRYPFERMSQILEADQAPLVRMNFDPATADAAHIPGAVELAGGGIAGLWRQMDLRSCADGTAQ